MSQNEVQTSMGRWHICWRCAAKWWNRNKTLVMFYRWKPKMQRRQISSIHYINTCSLCNLAQMVRTQNAAKKQVLWFCVYGRIWFSCNFEKCFFAWIHTFENYQKMVRLEDDDQASCQLDVWHVVACVTWFCATYSELSPLPTLKRQGETRPKDTGQLVLPVVVLLITKNRITTSYSQIVSVQHVLTCYQPCRGANMLRNLTARSWKQIAWEPWRGCCGHGFWMVFPSTWPICYDGMWWLSPLHGRPWYMQESTKTGLTGKH